jgi:hypothetical protein
MSFREWLYDQLLADDLIDEDMYTADDINEDMMLTETDLESYDIDIYRDQFEEHCKSVGVEPEWDVD